MRKVILVIVLILGAFQASAQGYRGRDFWIAFPQNAILEANKVLTLGVFICAESRTVVDITTPMDSSRQHILVEAGAAVEGPLDSAVAMRCSGQGEKRAEPGLAHHAISLYL